MEYKILKPSLYLEDQKLWLLSNEINSLSFAQIKGIVEDFENVFKGKYTASSFGYHTSIVDFDQNVARVEYHNEFITEISSKELYDVLVTWAKTLLAWETMNLKNED